MTKLKPYPSWVCSDCGLKTSKGKAYSCSTYHIDTCDVCGEKKPCTQPKDFFYPKFKGHKLTY